MDWLFKTMLYIHITGGATGLISGLLNLTRKKGDKKHRTTGNVFTWAMLCTGFSALILSVLNPNYFLFIVGVFTVYLVGTGKRYIYLKLLAKDQKAGITDRILTYGMLVAGIAFVISGILLLYSAKYFGIVLIVFGILSLLFVRKDLRHYKGITGSKNYWLLEHLQRMTGAFIAASTAFLVVNTPNLPFNPPSVLMWLLPTIILTPLIIYWSNKYRVKKD